MDFLRLTSTQDVFFCRRVAPHELVVMSYPHHMTEQEYLLFQRELKEIVMRDICGTL